MINVSGKTAQQKQVDWSASPAVDRSRIDTGALKFPGLFENRSQERISRRELGLVMVSMRVPRSEEWLPVKLWDFTSISFGVQVSSDNVSGEAKNSGAPTGGGQCPLLSLSVDDEVQIRVQVSRHQVFEIWCQVKNTVAWKDGVKIGLRRLDVNLPQSVDVDRREFHRLPVSPALSLKARVRHPFIFGHWCPLRVSDVNRNMGLSFVSHDPSILIFEGMDLRIHFELSAHRESPMTVRVTWVQATEANQVKFGVACVDMDLELHNGICGFLLFSRHWTPARLRECGFRSQRVKDRLRFRTVKTMDDYAEVLHLRRDAYVGAGKKPPGTRPEEMAGPNDGISRILMAHHHDKLVGSLTFTFPDSEETVLDSQAGFPGRKYPVCLPPKANLIEVSRLCVQGDYRSTDLLQGMFEHGVKHFLMSDRHWLLTSAVTDLLPSYERIGFRRVGASYRHPALNDIEHHLILAHRDTFLRGKGMNPLIWNGLFGGLIRHLLDRHLLRLPLPMAAWIRLKLLVGPVTRSYMENRSRRAFRKHLETMRRATSPLPESLHPSRPATPVTEESD